LTVQPASLREGLGAAWLLMWWSVRYSLQVCLGHTLETELGAQASTVSLGIPRSVRG
jgi:hypothetical protein